MPKKKRSSAVAKKAAHVKRIDIKLPSAVYEQVRQRVTAGQFLSMSAFGRTAIREKLALLKPARRKKK